MSEMFISLDSDLGSVRRVDVGSVSEVYAASIFRVEVMRCVSALILTLKMEVACTSERSATLATSTRCKDVESKMKVNNELP
jgi:hypothetical protein